MLIFAIVIALVVDAFAIWGAVSIFRRSPSFIARTVAVGFAVSAVIGTAAVASLATVGMQTRIIMAAMERQEPTATILATDRQMRAKLRTAVEEGLSKHGSKVENVQTSVGKVLKPYMAYRLSHAPDRFVIQSARATHDLLSRAKATGSDACSRVLAGDIATVRGLTTKETSAWLSDMLRADALDRTDTASAREIQAFIVDIAATRGWGPADVTAATRRTGPLACDYPLAAIEVAIRLPEQKAAAMLRGLGFGGMAVTAR